LTARACAARAISAFGFRRLMDAMTSYKKFDSTVT
jgi:hypothetical protein